MKLWNCERGMELTGDIKVMKVLIFYLHAFLSCLYIITVKGKLYFAIEIDIGLNSMDSFRFV